MGNIIQMSCVGRDCTGVDWDQQNDSKSKSVVLDNLPVFSLFIRLSCE